MPRPGLDGDKTLCECGCYAENHSYDPPHECRGLKWPRGHCGCTGFKEAKLDTQRRTTQKS